MSYSSSSTSAKQNTITQYSITKTESATNSSYSSSVIIEQSSYKPFSIFNPAISITLITIIALLSLLSYFLPTLIAKYRKHSNFAAIFVLNLFLGWSFFGWVFALIWSLLKQNETIQEKQFNVEETSL